MKVWILWMIFGVSLLFIDGHLGLSIGGCEQGSVDVVDGTNYSFTFNQSRLTKWIVFNSSDQQVCYCYFSSCIPPSPCRLRNDSLIITAVSSNLLISVGNGVNCSLRRIDPPNRVQLNHDCPAYVFDGSSVNCTCYDSRTGSPPGLVAWYGMPNSTLLLTNVSQNTSGKQFTCRLEWGPNRAIKEMISYMLTVAYGPSDVIINRIAETTDDESGIIRLTCAALYFYPSVVFQWSTTCEKRTDFTYFSVCSISLTQRVDHVAIECTATNTYFPQASFSRIYVLSFEEKGQEIEDPSAKCANIAIVGGVGASVFALVIIAAVLIAFNIKRQRDNRFGTQVGQETGGRTLALEPLTKSMPTTAGKQNYKDLSDTFYETSSKPAHIEHDYVDYSPIGHKANQSSDTYCAMVAGFDDDKCHYENVANRG